MVNAVKPLVLIIAAAIAATGAPAAVRYEKDVAVLEDGGRVAYLELVADWARFSPALKKTVRDGKLGLLNGERLPLAAQEWDAAASKTVWRQPAFTVVELPGLWRGVAASWLGWKSGTLVKKACKKDSCALTVVFEAGETKSAPYAIGVTGAGGALVVDSIECAGPVRGVLKLIEKGEAQWRPYATALALPEDSAPSSEYAVQDHCYMAPSPERQPTVRVRLGAVSGRIDTIVVSQGPWPGVTATYGDKKIESVARQRVGE